MKQLKDSTVNSTKLLENLLEWARSQTGTLKRNPVKLDLCHELLKITQSMKKMAGIKNQELEIIGCEESFVYADESMLNTILRNLISNAIKFTPDGGKISIYTKEIYVGPRQYTEVEIKDTEDTIPNFFKVDKNRSTKGTNGEKGTGLGLILCKEFVEKNHGGITVKSTYGKGTSFIFSIPAYKQ
jgi:two-component system sensor histidine kinase/response regulator